MIGKIQDVYEARDEGDYAISANNTLCFPYQMNYSVGEPYLSLSTDNGANWTNPGYSGGMVSIACSPTADTIVIGTSGNDVRYSHDGGATFSSSTGGNWGASVVGGMAWLPNGDIYAASAGQVYKSTDGGMTFTNLVPNPWIPMVMNEFIYAPNGMFYFWGPSGIYQSPDCITWTNITGNLPDAVQLIDVDLSSGYIYAVTDTNLYVSALSTGIEPLSDANAAMNINLFPNPANGSFTVQAGEAISCVTITDVCGKIVSVVMLTGNLTEARIGCGPAEAGMYLVTVESESGRKATQRLYVE